ncbi:MAG: NAD(P)/FAD-dependent oxidoreductase [Hyphomonadaceae bacterium]
MAAAFNAAYGMADSYYVATANPFAAAPPLDEDARADVVVVGGGFTGLSAALHAAKAGFSVILLDAGRIAWGASGRNGGQMIPGWRKGATELVARYGETRARDLFALSLEARALALSLIEENAIACDLRQGGHLTAAAKPSDIAWMREEAETLARVMGYETRVLSRAETEGLVQSSAFHGGFLDPGGGHLHPLNYALGLAQAARGAGVRLCEETEALAIEESAAGVRVRTARGNVSATYGVLACDALLGALDTQLAARIMPVANYVVATEPLTDAAALIAGDLAVSDSRFVVNYFRHTADGRLLFSGGERYTARAPESIEAFVRPHLARIFPSLGDVRIDYAWGGLVSITMSRMPHVGRRGSLFYAHGYSGQGVLLAAFAGKVLAEAMRGTAARFDVLAALAPPPFPGGAALRGPLYVLGMLYYALRDRL